MSTATEKATVTVTIDGKTLEVADGTLILDLARSQGIHIPTFCYQKRLTTLASCRMCLVEIEGHFSLEKRLQPACATRITDGMGVKTDTPLIAETRKSMLEILLANHPLDCPVCDKAGECELQDTVFAYGAGESRFTDDKRVFRSEDIHLNPVIVFNAQRCIQCQRCVRMCEEVVGAVALGTAERGMDAEITGFGNSLAGCDHCGNCIEVCPVGALMSSPYRYKARPWDLTEVDTICPYCGTGCHLTVGLRDGRLARVRSKYETGVNGETLCVKGRFGLDFIDGKDKLRRPMVRKGGTLAAVSWEEALSHIASRARAAAEKGAVGGLVSPRLANEALYLFQKLMRTAFHSNSIDSSTRWSAANGDASGSDAPGSDVLGPYQALEGLFGGLYARRSLHRVLEADCILVVGSNVTESNPVSEYLMRDAARNRGKQLFVVSSRPSRLDSGASASLRLRPGAEVPLLAAMLRALSGNGGNGGNGGEVPPSCREFLECVVAALSAAPEVAILVGVDVLRSPSAAAALRLLGDLGRALEAAGKRAGIQFLFDRPNQMGAWELGALPTVLPGWRPVDDAPARALFEEAWGMSLPSQPGADFHQMLTRCEAGEMDMLYVVGSDPLLSYPGGELVASALSKCGLLVVQDAFFSATARLADVVLPAAAFAEEAGTFTSNEGRVQKLRPLRRPAFEARSNMEIFALLASALGHDLGSATAPDVFSEITSLVPSYAGLAGLGGDAIGSGEGAFTVASAGKVAAAPDDAPVAVAGPPQGHESGELELVTGDCLFHSGYVSWNSALLRTLAAGPYVEMSPREASALGLSDRDPVVVRSRHGEAKARLKVTKRFPDGVVFIPENFPEMRLNLLMKQGEHPCRVAVCKEEDEIRDAVAT